MSLLNMLLLSFNFLKLIEYSYNTVLMFLCTVSIICDISASVVFPSYYGLYFYFFAWIFDCIPDIVNNFECWNFWRSYKCCWALLFWGAIKVFGVSVILLRLAFLLCLGDSRTNFSVIQRLANCGPQASCLFWEVKLFWNTATPVWWHIICDMFYVDIFYAPTAELGDCSRGCMAHSLKYLVSDPLRSLPTSGLS